MFWQKKPGTAWNGICGFWEVTLEKGVTVLDNEMKSVRKQAEHVNSTQAWLCSGITGADSREV